MSSLKNLVQQWPVQGVVASTAERQIARLDHVRQTRDETRLEALLTRFKEQAKDPDQNLMPVTIDLVKAGATMGDIVEAGRDVWGSYRETPVF